MKQYSILAAMLFFCIQDYCSNSEHSEQAVSITDNFCTKAGLSSKTFGDLIVRRILDTQFATIHQNAVIHGNLTVHGELNGVSNSSVTAQTVSSGFSYSYHTGSDLIANTSYQLISFDNPCAISNSWVFDGTSGSFSSSESGTYGIAWSITAQRISSATSSSYSVTTALFLDGSELTGTAVHALFPPPSYPQSQQLNGIALINYTAGQPLQIKWKADLPIFQLYGASGQSAQLIIIKLSN